MERLKTLSYPYSEASAKAVSGKFLCASFLGDTKYLALLGEDIEMHIFIFQWDKEKLHKTACLGNLKPNKIVAAPTGICFTTSGPQVILFFNSFHS
jgi:hypothetical protein